MVSKPASSLDLITNVSLRVIIWGDKTSHKPLVQLLVEVSCGCESGGVEGLEVGG